ncbi:hypothetical protein RclHR1_00350001 [Rhizophagus clarus]|uniref:Uncharacterized protein n=1 Tax=Rhizophagus clarus TaxID=94130 RepID=A0A2Z6RAH6_9GLOM|nr:hypothetical protein RclHR1_00350001 [Rhizophagus clarus]
MLILEHWSEWYNIMVKKWVFLEAEEAKTSINSHHIQVCIDCSNNLGNHYYYLLSYWLQISHAINRYIWLEFDINEGVDIKNTIQGICGTSVAYLESERKRIKIAQFEKRPLKKPNLQVSDHSIPTSNWNMPLPHKSNVLNTEIIDTNLGSGQVLNHTFDFALPSEWALKENQKFGKKEGGKRINKNVILYLEAYFLAGDI